MNTLVVPEYHLKVPVLSYSQVDQLETEFISTDQHSYQRFAEWLSGHSHPTDATFTIPGGTFRYEKAEPLKLGYQDDGPAWELRLRYHTVQWKKS